MALATGEKTEKYGAAKFRRPLRTRIRIYARAMTDVFLILLWLPATFTGLILWEPMGFVPEGPGKGERIMLWGLTTAEWGDIHWWISAAAVGMTLVHVALDFKAFKGAVKYLVHARGLPN